jgi:hypothetical protein
MGIFISRGEARFMTTWWLENFDQGQIPASEISEIETADIEKRLATSRASRK